MEIERENQLITRSLFCMCCIISDELCVFCQLCRIVYVLPHLAILRRLIGTQALATMDTLTENKHSETSLFCDKLDC